VREFRFQFFRVFIFASPFSNPLRSFRYRRPFAPADVNEVFNGLAVDHLIDVTPGVSVPVLPHEEAVSFSVMTGLNER